MTLQSKIVSGEIEEIEMEIGEIEKRLNQAIVSFNYGKKDCDDLQFYEVSHAQIYDSTRMVCEVILLFNKYRVKVSAEKRHRTVINATEDILGPEFKNEFLRLQKARGKRNALDYGIAKPVSKAELDQSIEDAKKLFKKATDLLHEKRQPLNI